MASGIWSRHAVRAEDQTWAWDGDHARWTLVSASGALSVIRAFTPGVLLLDAVYQIGSNAVDRASSSAKATSRVLGFIKALNSPSPGLCEVQVAGDVGGFAGLVPGQAYLLSKALGGIVADDDTGNIDYPDAPGNVLVILGVANTVDTMLSVTGGELKELNA